MKKYRTDYYFGKDSDAKKSCVSQKTYFFDDLSKAIDFFLDSTGAIITFDSDKENELVLGSFLGVKGDCSMIAEFKVKNKDNEWKNVDYEDEEVKRILKDKKIIIKKC